MFLLWLNDESARYLSSVQRKLNQAELIHAVYEEVRQKGIENGMK